MIDSPWNDERDFPSDVHQEEDAAYHGDGQWWDDDQTWQSAPWADDAWTDHNWSGQD